MIIDCHFLDKVLTRYYYNKFSSNGRSVISLSDSTTGVLDRQHIIVTHRIDYKMNDKVIVFDNGTIVLVKWIQSDVYRTELQYTYTEEELFQRSLVDEISLSTEDFEKIKRVHEMYFGEQ